MLTKFNLFTLLSFSPWPLMCSLNAMNLILSLLTFMKTGDLKSLNFSILMIFSMMMSWWMFFYYELNFLGSCSELMEKNMKFSMILFITSEIMFFFAFFWSYFHFYLSPLFDLSFMWPPMNLEFFDYMSMPLINTIVLSLSAVAITLSHRMLIKMNFSSMSLNLFLTLTLGLLFTALQAKEYSSSMFCISDSSFGSSFFLLTGFHGIHVMIGSFFILTVKKYIMFNVSKNNFLSFEMAAWYWHMVDTVWLFLFLMIYYMC